MSDTNAKPVPVDYLHMAIAAERDALRAQLNELKAENRTIIKAATADHPLTAQKTAHRLVKIIARQAQTAREDALREAADMGHAHASEETRNAVRRAILTLIQPTADRPDAEKEE